MVNIHSNTFTTSRFPVCFLVAVALLNVCYSDSLLAENAVTGETVWLGRYVRVPAEPTDEQKNLLQVLVGPMKLGSHIYTVGDAIRFLLQRSGYTLARLDESNVEMESLLKLSLPLVHRTIGPISIHDALKTLAGPAWTLQVDDVNRTICFVLTRYTNIDNLGEQ